MQGPCILVPYITEHGRSDVLEFLSELERRDPDCYAKYLYAKDLIAENGTDIGAPHWKWLGDGLGEIRWRSGRRRIRITCSEEHHQRIAMLDPIPAKTWDVFENHDRRKALKRRADFRDPTYDQESRHFLYLSKHRPHAGNQ